MFGEGTLRMTWDTGSVFPWGCDGDLRCGEGAVRLGWKEEERGWNFASRLEQLHCCPPQWRPEFLNWLSPSPGC